MKIKTITSLFLAFFFVLNVYSSDIPTLKEILKNTEAYSEKLKNASLDFYCKEEIVELIYKPPIKRRLLKNTEVFKRTYLYDYQLIKKKDNKQERRYILKANGIEVLKRKTDLSIWSKYKFVVMGPYGIFGKEWQSKFNYKIAKRKKIKGEKVIIVKAVPKKKVRLDHMWGKAWVRERDFAILKIEWDQTSMKGLGRLSEKIGPMAVPQYKLISVYGIKHNGIMFPTDYSVIEEYYLKTKGYNVINSKIKVKYFDYKFSSATVEDVKVRMQ